MTLSLEHILGVAATLVATAFGWVWRELVSLRRAHNELRDDHADHRTAVAEKYVTKDDMESAFNRVYAALERIEKKLDANH